MGPEPGSNFLNIHAVLEGAVEGKEVERNQVDQTSSVFGVVSLVFLLVPSDQVLKLVLGIDGSFELLFDFLLGGFFLHGGGWCRYFTHLLTLSFLL